MFKPGDRFIHYHTDPNDSWGKNYHNIIFTFERYNSCNPNLLCVEEMSQQLKSMYCIPIRNKTPEDWL